MSKKTVVTPETETPAHNVPEQGQTSVAVSSGGAATLHTWRNIRLIIGREYKNRVTQRSFIITSIILLVIVFLAAFVPTLVQLITAGPTSPTSQTHIVVVNDARSVAGLNETTLTSYINSDLNGTNTSSNAPYAITYQPAASLGSLQNQVKSGQLDILLVLARAPNQDLRFTYDTDASATNDGNQSTIQALAQLLTFLDTAHRLGLTSQETQRLGASPDFTTVHAQQSQNSRPVSEIAAGYVLAYAGVILIYASMALYAGIVAAGVAEEKSSRMMELLLNAATPFQLLADKIVGIGAACLTQMGCLVVVGIAALLLQTPLQAALFGASAGGFSQYLTGVSIPFYLLFLLYFLLGFFLYATLYAGLAAMVKRQEEVQSSIMLPQMLIISGYVLFFFVVFSPDTTLTKVLSYIPFWTPMLMLARLAVGTVAWWEIVVTTALMLGAILACTWFAARLYRYGVLMYGQRPGLGQLLKLVRMN
ncbi:MAG: ABC transporter permease [Ktedonobacteraceae bacterium]